ARHLDPVGTEGNARAHLLQHFGKAHIALDAVASYADHPYRSTGDRARGEKVRRGGRVALDIDLAGRDVGIARYVKRAPAVDDHFDAEFAHHVDGDGDIGFGDERAIDIDLAAARQRQRDQQSTQVLGGNVAAHLYVPFDADVPRVDRQRRV